MARSSVPREFLHPQVWKGTSLQGINLSHCNGQELGGDGVSLCWKPRTDGVDEATISVKRLFRILTVSH